MEQDRASESQIKITPRVFDELSKVATSPKKSALILAVICAIVGYVVFSLFFADSGAENKTADPLPLDASVAKPASSDQDRDIPPIPKLPTPPKIEEPKAPVLPPQEENKPEILPPLPVAKPELTTSITQGNPALPKIDAESQEARKRKDAKRKSSIILLAGAVSGKSIEQQKEEADFSFRGDMNLILGKGKIIDAVIETAIDTDFGGELRAVVKRDVYSEWGKNILIPKGSRVFGIYTSGINGAYGHVSVAWNRIDLISGYSVNLSGKGVDSLGKPGVLGRLDPKFKEQFANAVLKSAFNVVTAKLVDTVVKPPATSQESATNSALATSVRSSAVATYGDTTQSAAQRRETICANTTALITDKGSTAYTTIDAACTSLRTDSTSTDDQKLSSLLATVNTAADSLLSVANSTVQATKQQDSAKKAFTDITKVVEEAVTSQNFTPTITVPQGTAVKIYVDRDYKFPKSALKPTGVLK